MTTGVATPGGAASVSVIVPLYNHAATMHVVHERLHSFLAPRWPRYEIVFVDDCSTDGTAEQLDRLVRVAPGVVAVTLDRNAGQSDAIAAGLELARGEILVTTDADLETGLAAIGRVIAAVEAGAELACGRRVGRDLRLHRRAGSWLMNRVLHALSSTPLRDFGCGLNAGSRALLERWQEARRGRHVIKLALAALARRVEEVDVDLREVPGSERVEVRAHLLDASRYGMRKLIALGVDVARFYLWPTERPLVAGVRTVVRFPAPHERADVDSRSSTVTT